MPSNKDTFQEKVKAFSGSHDFSHCDISEPHSECYHCKRLIAHYALQNIKEAQHFLVSYLSKPETQCINKDYKLFAPF